MARERVPKGHFLTVGEVAEILRLHPRTVYRLIDEGRLPAWKFPDGKPIPLARRSPLRVLDRDLYAWLEKVGHEGVADARDRRKKETDN